MADQVVSSKRKPQVPRTSNARGSGALASHTSQQERAFMRKTTSKKPCQDIFDRKQEPEFEEYWSKEKVSQGLRSGELVEGVLRISSKDYKECYISDPESGPDWLVHGELQRNRAMEGDLVVLQPYPPEYWMPYQDQSESDLLESTGASDTDEGVGLVPTPLSCSTEGLEWSSAEPMKETLIDRLCSVPALTDDLKHQKPLICQGKDLRKFRRTAKVVCISRFGHNRTCAGRVKIFSKIKGLAFFCPIDSRIPRLFVPLSSCPKDLPMVFKKYEATMFACRIVKWPKSSPFAYGEIVSSLGEGGDIESETQRILLDQGINDGEFSPASLACLPSTDEKAWEIPPEEEQKRRDFRKECVLSIDPSNARDLDDAVHCTELSPGVYEVGVHIADVSYFVEAGTALDSEAAERATSVYLVQRVIPMLPRKLSEELCSLNPNKDRLTVSVVWKLTDKGELLDQWIGRSMIRSVAKLSYNHAQMMIDDPAHSWKCEDFPSIADEEKVPHIVKSVITLNKLAKWFRSLRRHKGSLQLNQDGLTFTLDPETGLPNGCHVSEYKESNCLIEEFMVLANIAVAHHISNACPKVALLRKHPSPKDRSLDNLKSQCAKVGVILDTRDSATLQASLNKFDSNQAKLGVDQETVAMKKKVLANNCMMVMELARYFCVGCTDGVQRYHHYALNISHYTHFTSPIRRYADVLVHRILTSSLGEGPSFKMQCDEVQEQAARCNKMKKAAKTADEQSIQLFLAAFLQECGSWTGTGMVTAVLNRAVDIFLFQFGLVKRVYCENLPLNDFTYEPTGNRGSQLTLVWNDEVAPELSKQVQTLEVFSIVKASLCCVNKTTLQLQATIFPTV